MYTKLLQSCSTLCDPMECSPPGSSVCGILQARILECPPPGGLPDSGIEPMSSVAPALQADSLPLSHQGSMYICSAVRSNNSDGSEGSFAGGP